jgi:hypothetical protein
MQHIVLFEICMIIHGFACFHNHSSTILYWLAHGQHTNFSSFSHDDRLFVYSIIGLLERDLLVLNYRLAWDGPSAAVEGAKVSSKSVHLHVEKIMTWSLDAIASPDQRGSLHFVLKWGVLGSNPFTSWIGGILAFIHALRDFRGEIYVSGALCEKNMNK